jgi:hypothetical protein
MGQRHSTRLNSHQGNISFGLPFGNFMGDPPHRSVYSFPIHHLYLYHFRLLEELTGSR